MTESDKNKKSIPNYRIKPLEGKAAEKFLTALKTSKVRKEAVDKAKNVALKVERNEKNILYKLFCE